MYRASYERKRFGRRKRSPETIFWVCTLIVMVAAGIGLAVYYNLAAAELVRDTRQQTLTAVTAVEKPKELSWTPVEPLTHTNILLLGLDNHGMADAIMILSYNMTSYDSALIAVKRDTFVDFQTWRNQDSGQDHLAWATHVGMGPEKDYHAGARLMAQTVEELLGIELHAYAAITFEGFVSMIDSIGGVLIDVDSRFAQLDGQPLPTGLQRLTGKQALTYARHRQNPRIDMPGSASHDGDRVRRNQLLLKAIIQQCKTFDLSELEAMLDMLEDHLHTSLDYWDWDILDLANILYNRDPETIQTIVLPGSGDRIYQSRIDRDVYYYFLDLEESDRILRELQLK